MGNVIGIRDLSGHTGSGRAAVVVLGRAPEPGAKPRAESGASPEIIRRTDVTLVIDRLPARVYHDAAGRRPTEARALVSRVGRATQRAADDVLGGLLAGARRRQQLARWGQRVCMPWRREHKEAALGAWLATLVSVRADSGP